MGFFNAFREKPSATRYEELHTTANFDVFDATLIYVFCALGFSFLILLPGYMLKEVRKFRHLDISKSWLCHILS
mgnify:CR=1 FL=1